MTSIDFERVFQGLPGLFLILRPDADFTIIGASDAYLQSTGTIREAIVGKGIFEVFPGAPDRAHGATMNNLSASLQRVLASKAAETMPVQRYDLRRPGEAGMEQRFWSPVNSPVLSEKGEILYIIHRVEDVTERGVAEKNLRATEILESITEGFFALDRDWRFTYVNREACDILSCEPDALLGKVIWEEYTGLAGSRFERSYRQAMNEHQASSMTAHYTDHDRFYEVRTYPAPHGISVYFRNVTAEKKAEAERDRLLAETGRHRRIYEAALSNTPDLIYVFDLNHRFIYANEALLAALGKNQQEALGKTCLELGYEPWHAEMHNREIDQVAATRAPIRGEVPFSGTSGRRVYDYIFVPVLGPDGSVVAVAGSTRDITDRQRAEQAIRLQAERLRDADRAKDEFLATLAHELRNPLAPLSHSLSLLRLGQSGEGSAAPVHEIMERQITHMVRLVDDLLEMSRISRGDLELRKERVEAAAIIRNALETSSPLIEAAGHHLSVALPDQPLWLEGDPVRLAQILSNLLNNAAKYSGPGGRISVQAQRQNNTVAISVLDTGDGIEEHMLPRIFEMFSRGDPTSKRAQGGLGIGLALARRLAEMHGGVLDAHSDGPGKGSEFTILLPLAADQAAPAVTKEHATVKMGQKRILVVDDNVDAADSLGMLLKVLGADVRVAHDGRDALALFPDYLPAIVLLDIGMPGMDGYEVARTIRTRFGKDVTIVALTGWGQDKDRQRARDAGFDHHLVKPAEIDALQALLASLDDKADSKA